MAKAKTKAKRAKAKRAKRRKNGRTTRTTTIVQKRTVKSNPRAKKRRAKKRAKNPTKYVVSKSRSGKGQRVQTKDGVARTIRKRKPAKKNPKSGYDALRDAVASALRNAPARLGATATATAAYWRKPLASRAARIRSLARGTPKQRRGAAALAKLERRHEEGPPRRRNPALTDAEARRDYKDKHWGEPGTRRIRRAAAADPTHGTAVALGELREVTYRTRKRGDGGTADYTHTFGEEGGRRPKLAYNDGGLLVVGGDYLIKDGGITN